MSNSILGPKPGRSIAAFLWMPQFRLSTQHMAHIGPVFMRTLAVAFVQAGLLPRNHPALMYGAQGVRKYGVSELIGEAWHNLRVSRADASQWGIFIAVMLMMAMIVGSLVTFMLTVVLGFGSVAQAQLFSHPLGDSSMSGGYASNYRSQVGAFDTSIPAAGTPGGDYGLMMLDKVIRAGAYGQGTSLQNATRALMEVYNSGVLVIASVMIFWIIVSIVVDTAKTGQVGGGRHNMVWAPIRIVFALALLVPLGSAGYSAGQFMVMKVAEWGSNLGTNAWVAYVDAVGKEMSLLAASSESQEAARNIVYAYQKVLICQAVVNSHLKNAGNEDIGRYVREKNATVLKHSDGSPVTGELAYKYGGGRYDGDICGKIIYQVGAKSSQEAATSFGSEAQAIRGFISSIDTFKNRTKDMYYENFIKYRKPMEDFACQFAGTHESLRDKDIIMHLKQGERHGRNPGKPEPVACGKGTGESLPLEEQETLRKIADAYAEDASKGFQDSVKKFAEGIGPGMTQLMTERGWAGMGTWYHQISIINGTMFALSRPTITVSEGDLMMIDTSGGSVSSWFRNLFSDNQWVKDAQGSMQSYEEWLVASPDNLLSSDDVSSAPIGKGDSGKSFVATMISSKDPIDLVNTSLSAMGFSDSSFIMSLMTLFADKETYPLATLTGIANSIWLFGLFLIGSAIGLQSLVSVLPFIQTASVHLFPILSQIGVVLVAAGLVLKYYVPLLPFIRVMFSVLTWIISVFEAVALVPIAALAHISSEGEGLSGGASHVWKLWLNILLRPVLTVVGFVGAMLVFNAFVVYVNAAFALMAETRPDGPVNAVFFPIFMAILYVFVMYMVANSVFKMLDLIPAGLSRWIGGPADASFDDGDDKTIMLAASHQLANIRPQQRDRGGGGDKTKDKDKPGAGATEST